MSTPRWSRLQWLAAVIGAVVVAALVGVPTGLIPTPFYTRMTPAPWWSYAVWTVTAIVSGLLIATFVRSSAPSRGSGAGIMANIGSLLAVGCPICNKVVVAAIGVTGALNLWAPLQPVIAAVSLAMLLWALWFRLRLSRSCPTPAGVPAAPRVEDGHGW